MAGDFVFMCINNDKSLAPIIMPGDVNLLVSVANIRINFYPPRDLRKLTKKIEPQTFQPAAQFLFPRNSICPHDSKKTPTMCATPLHLLASL